MSKNPEFVYKGPRKLYNTYVKWHFKENMRVIFQAQIKNISTKQLASGDYSTDITLRIDNPDTTTLNAVNNINTNQGVVAGLSDGEDDS